MRTDDPEVRVRKLEAEVARLARVERRMERLLAVTGALAGTHSREDVARIAAEQGLDAVGASTAGGEDLDASERTFLAILSNHCALALSRIDAERRLEVAYHEERVSRVLADEATRAREEILSVVSHDLRNPLGTILMGASTLLHAGAPDDPKGQRVRGIAERIHRQSERMARLIEDLMDFAGIEAGRLVLERRPATPMSIVAHAAEPFAPIAQERGVTFSQEVAADLPKVDCDPARAAQVLSSLAGNAIKVTPKSGQITMGVRAAAREVVFFVRDTGPGIDADELPTLFQRFWRSKKPSYKGAGLGLSIARGIVDAHGGRIWVESQPGAGSTFYFTVTPPA
jgi:signal transduction histidine kinase